VGLSVLQAFVRDSNDPASVTQNHRGVWVGGWRAGGGVRVLVGAEGMRAAALWVAALAGLVCVASSSKEFADCGSTSLTPLKLELDPDPAEVRPTRTRPSLDASLRPQLPAGRGHRRPASRSSSSSRWRPRRW